MTEHNDWVMHSGGGGKGEGSIYQNTKEEPWGHLPQAWSPRRRRTGRKLNKGISSCLVEAEGEAGNVAGDEGTMTRGGNSWRGLVCWADEPGLYSRDEGESWRAGPGEWCGQVYELETSLHGQVVGGWAGGGNPARGPRLSLGWDVLRSWTEA